MPLIHIIADKHDADVKQEDDDSDVDEDPTLIQVLYSDPIPLISSALIAAQGTNRCDGGYREYTPYEAEESKRKQAA